MGAAFIGELIRILDAAHADARGRRYLEGCWSCDRCQRDPRNRRVDRLRAVRAMQRRRSWCRTQGTQLVQSQDEAKPLSATGLTKSGAAGAAVELSDRKRTSLNSSH